MAYLNVKIDEELKNDLKIRALQRKILLKELVDIYLREGLVNDKE